MDGNIISDNGNERDHKNAGNNDTLLLLREMNCTKNARQDIKAFCYLGNRNK